MQTRGTPAHTPPHYATLCPTNTNFDARRSAGMGRQAHLEERRRRLFIAAPSSRRVAQEESAKPPSSRASRLAPCARHAIIQITDSISLSVMCKCDLISTYPPPPLSLSPPLPFTKTNSAHSFAFVIPAVPIFSSRRLKRTRAVKSTLPCHIPRVDARSVGRAGPRERENVIDIRRLAVRPSFFLPDGEVFEVEQCGQSGHSTLTSRGSNSVHVSLMSLFVVREQPLANSIWTSPLRWNLDYE